MIRGAQAIARVRADLESRAVELLAGKPPAPGGPCLVLAALRIGAELERMGGSSAQLAGIARRRHPAHAIPAELSALVARIAVCANETAPRT